MEVSILLAVIAIVGNLILALVTHRNNKENNLAEIRLKESNRKNIEVDTMIDVIGQLRLTVDEHRVKILELIEEINSLKGKEHIHLLEKVRLEEKIKRLEDENTTLQARVTKNQASYLKQINTFKDQIRQLKEDLKNGKQDN